MRRWLLLIGVTLTLALALAMTSTYTTQANEPTRTPPPNRPIGTPTPARPLPLPIRPEELTLHTGGQTIGGPAQVRDECGSAHPLFSNRMGRNTPLEVTVTIINEGSCEVHLGVISPTDPSPVPANTITVAPGKPMTVALSVPSLSSVVALCRGANDTRCAFEWRIDQLR